ncbi:MAG: DUF1800 domain-containing protein, partial [Xanthomonadales bacterium]|nr:DUF1800 domain-containing protein [Xanthomonadales bacterium]
PLERRDLIKAGVAFGVAGAALAMAERARAAPPGFDDLVPMRPAPEVAEGVTPAPPPLAAMVYNKAAFGPRPGDIDAFNALAGNDPQRLAMWVDNQLNPTGADPAVDSRLSALLGSPNPDDVAAFDTVDKTALQLWTEHARSDDYQVKNRPVWQMERLTLLRGAYSQWQLREVLYDFWFNHFNVFGREFPTQGMMPEYDRQIRAHLFGNFGDMLHANSRTACMLYYLDNYANTWPNPNENYAREVLELHTLGAIENYYGAVDPNSVGNNSQGQRAGYTEIDVFEFAKALTGWGVSDTTDGSPDTGEFIFRPARHYNFSQGPIEVMDITINAPGGGESDVTTILDYLAGHYGTARFIAWKLCTRLIGDNPPESIVSSTADEFYARRFDADQLKEVYRHVLLSSEFQSTWGAKVKRPVETLIRAMRGSDVDLSIRIDHGVSNSIFGRLDDTSHYPFGYGPPTGFPDERELWQGTGPLIMSWRTITYMLRRSDENLPGSGPMLNLAEQTNTLIPLSANRTPQNIVATWMDRVLGYALPSGVSDRMEQFITGIAGIAANQSLHDFTDTNNIGASSTYQRIIRGVVGLVLMAPDAMRR